MFITCCVANDVLAADRRMKELHALVRGVSGPESVPMLPTIPTQTTWRALRTLTDERHRDVMHMLIH